MNEAVESALETGYRLFDTAHGYRNEPLLGAALSVSHSMKTQQTTAIF